MAPKMENIVGKKYGRLTVLEYAGKDKNNNIRWLCECDCSNKTKKVILGQNLKHGLTKSCGCLNDETRREKATKHGMSRKKLYKVYMSMKDRCYNESHKFYKDYGGRGIKICEEWMGDNGLENFYNWSTENGYKEGLTIDRKNVNGNYEPSNCRWATMEEQGSNKRNNIWIEMNGMTKTLSQWSRESGIPINTLWNRLKKGFDSDEFLNPPHYKLEDDIILIILIDLSLKSIGESIENIIDDFNREQFDKLSIDLIKDEKEFKKHLYRVVKECHKRLTKHFAGECLEVQN